MPETFLARVSPALEAYSNRVVEANLWRRPGLHPRDRSIVTISALIARGQMAGFSAQVERALINGVTPAEISEIVTHLAFYAGWSSALAALPVIAAVFDAREIAADQIPAADVDLLPLDAVAEAARVASVGQMLGDAVGGLAHFTTDPLFSEVWLRPGLRPRDRSLTTLASTMALGQLAQFRAHLNRGMDNGLTAVEAGEVVAHLAFYSGWPTAFSAGPVVREVIESRE